VECDTTEIAEGNRVVVSLDDTEVRVIVPSREIDLACTPIPPLMQHILERGGLVAYLRDGGEFRL
jgi:hypothetical protein